MSADERTGTEQPVPRRWLALSDADLLAQCDIDVYRASGPGGQKRNKTSSAVRLRHGPSGLIVTAVESRSQHENRARALRRLRRSIALHERSPIPAGDTVPDYYAEALGRDPSLHVNRRNPDYPKIMQYVLDVFVSVEARTSDAAKRLNISTGQLVRFLKDDPKLWEHANELRASFGHPLLR